MSYFYVKIPNFIYVKSIYMTFDKKKDEIDIDYHLFYSNVTMMY